MPRTTDPCPNVELRAARAAMEPFLAALAAKPEVQAIYILSTSACSATNYTVFDEESDFDIALVLDVPMDTSEWRSRKSETYRLLSDRIPAWTPNFLYRVPVPWGLMEVNVHQLILAYESDERTTWTGDKCDVYLNKSEKIIDHGDRFAEVAQRKAQKGRIALEQERLRLANRITWDIREVPLRQARRHGPEVGHYVLNLAIEEVIDCIFVTAGHFVPHKKWKLSLLVDYALITRQQVAIFHHALQCVPTSMVDLERRISILEAFCDSIEGMIVSGHEALDVRRRFQATIQLRATTCADTAGLDLERPLAAAMHDLVNYKLCGSSADVALALQSSDLFAIWRTVARQVRQQQQPVSTGGLVNVDHDLQHADEA